MNDNLIAHAKEKRVETKEAWIRATDKNGAYPNAQSHRFPHEFYRLTALFRAERPRGINANRP